MFMDTGVIRRRILAHQLHRFPIFASFVFIERKPGESLQFFRQLRMFLRRELAVEIANGRANSTASAMTQQRHVRSGLKPMNFFTRRKHSELNEMVSASTGSKL